MAAERKCCVRGCEKTRKENNIVLHKFPNPDNARFRTWAFAVGGDIISLEDNYVYKYRRLCHEHFEPKYLAWSKMLTKNAVPTLHLKGFVIRRNPLIDITNREGPSVQDLNAASTSDQGLLPEECKDTADLLLFFDELFDSLNGSYNNSAKKSGKVLLQALTPRSKHQDIWNESKKY